MTLLLVLFLNNANIPLFKFIYYIVDTFIHINKLIRIVLDDFKLLVYII